MQIISNYSLAKLNTFGIDTKALFFAEVRSEDDLPKLFSSPEFKQSRKMFLGGGSNVLFTGDFEGIIVLNKLKGIEVVKEDSDYVSLRSLGGELWQDLVLFAVNRKYWGIENLSLIPGTVGAAPVQNIGAYGVEIKDFLESVEAYDIETGTKKTFSNNECEFGYRESVFKNKMKGKYFISAIVLRLSKTRKEEAVYKTLDNYLRENKIIINSPKDISDAVVAIRKSKLPDPKILGSAGSFFKNIFVTNEELAKLKEKYTNMPVFKEGESIKIPAGWLIEQCGWKGKRIGNVGVHENQALVLVNYGGATGREVVDLANKIILSVKQKFDLELVPEVNIV